MFEWRWAYLCSNFTPHFRGYNKCVTLHQNQTCSHHKNRKTKSYLKRSSMQCCTQCGTCWRRACACALVIALVVGTVCLWKSNPLVWIPEKRKFEFMPCAVWHNVCRKKKNKTTTQKQNTTTTKNNKLKKKKEEITDKRRIIHFQIRGKTLKTYFYKVAASVLANKIIYFKSINKQYCQQHQLMCHYPAGVQSCAMNLDLHSKRVIFRHNALWGKCLIWQRELLASIFGKLPSMFSKWDHTKRNSRGGGVSVTWAAKMSK